MRDLFSNDQEFRKIEMPEADIALLSDLDTHESYESILLKLIQESKWQQREMNMWGKKVKQPRLTCWYGDPGRHYSYSGIVNHPLPWTDTLRELKRRVEDCTEARFNSVLLNYYRDQNDSMSAHSDNEAELGSEPVIASLSFGALRTFIFKHKTRKELKIVKLPLPSGSVLLMKGKTQKKWVHAINKEKHFCGPRVNLTFRYIYTSDELDRLQD